MPRYCLWLASHRSSTMRRSLTYCMNMWLRRVPSVRGQLGGNLPDWRVGRGIILILAGGRSRRHRKSRRLEVRVRISLRRVQRWFGGRERHPTLLSYMIAATFRRTLPRHALAPGCETAHRETVARLALAVTVEEPAQVAKPVPGMGVLVLLGVVASQGLTLEVRGISPASLERADQYLTRGVDLQSGATFDERIGVVVDGVQTQGQAVVTLTSTS